MELGVEKWCSKGESSLCIDLAERGDIVDSNASTAILPALLSFLGAVVGVAITVFYASKNNNKNIFINTVTTERAKWRDELRKDTAEFCKLVYGELHRRTSLIERDLKS